MQTLSKCGFQKVNLPNKTLFRLQACARQSDSRFLLLWLILNKTFSTAWRCMSQHFAGGFSPIHSGKGSWSACLWSLLIIKLLSKLSKWEDQYRWSLLYNTISYVVCALCNLAFCAVLKRCCEKAWVREETHARSLLCESEVAAAAAE